MLYIIFFSYLNWYAKISWFFNKTRKISLLFFSRLSAQKFVILARKPETPPYAKFPFKSIRHTTLSFRPTARSSSVHNADWHRRDFSRSSTCIEDTAGAHIKSEFYCHILWEPQSVIFRKSNNFTECRERDFHCTTMACSALLYIILISFFLNIKFTSNLCGLATAEKFSSIDPVTYTIINSLNNHFADDESRVAANENLAISWLETRRGRCYITIYVTEPWTICNNCLS